MKRTELDELQSTKLAELLRLAAGDNPFYRRKLAAAGYTPERPPQPADLADLPYTRKEELVADQAASPPYGSILTYPLTAYTRLHQTSGTTGQPLRWLDTAASWSWFLDGWQRVLSSAGITAEDRVFCAFSFGPFIGFWGAFEAAHRLGALALTGGALNTAQRLEHLFAHQATVLLSTPTYGLRMAEVAAEMGLDLAAGPVRLAIQAGEPGASVPNVRQRLAAAWGARIVDHAGATEVGPWGFACGVEDHMHVNEREFVAELVDPESERRIEAPDGGRGELVLTNLGRLGSPVLRYRTGDLVELRREPCPCGRPDLYLRGGVLGRIDDMIIVRGVNVYPAAIENVIREFPAVAEFEVEVRRHAEMSELRVRIEVSLDGDGLDTIALEVSSALRSRLSLRVEIEPVASGTLPRYELKARRFKFLDDEPGPAP